MPKLLLSDLKHRSDFHAAFKGVVCPCREGAGPGAAWRTKRRKEMAGGKQMLNLNRRNFLGGTAAAGAAVAGGLSSLSETATAAGLNLPAALPQGLRDNVIMDVL